MNNILKVLLIALLVNFIISFLVFLFNMRKSKAKGLLMAIIVFFAPVFSELYFIMIGFFKIIMKLFRLDTVDISDLAARSKMQVIEAANIELERNKVPLEESLIISDRVDRRNAFLEILKTGGYESIQSIQKAVEDPDSEISHYAAAYLSEEVAKFKRQEKELEKSCDLNKDLPTLYKYVDYVGGFLSKNIMMIEEEKRYADFLDEKLWDIVELSEMPLEGAYISLVVSVFQFVQNDEEAKKWVDYALKYAQNDLETAKVCLKYFYNKKDYKRFKKLLEEIKSSPMLLDNETVEWVRFFNNTSETKT